MKYLLPNGKKWSSYLLSTYGIKVEVPIYIIIMTFGIKKNINVEVFMVLKLKYLPNTTDLCCRI